jgi:hypothetical protein
MVAVYHKMTGRITFSKGTVSGLTKMNCLAESVLQFFKL